MKTKATKAAKATKVAKAKATKATAAGRIKLIAGRAVQVVKRFKSWSFSRYNDYRLCALYAKLRHLDKVAEPGSDAKDRGATLGRAAEAYIKGTEAKLHHDLRSFRALFDDLRSQYKKRPRSMVVEDSWEFTAGWEPITKAAKDYWERCVIRVKVDVARMLDPEDLEVIDWKSGKYKDDRNQEYVEQLELYALAALIVMPEIKRVHCRLAYTDLGITYPRQGAKVFVRADVPRLKKLWADRTRAMMADRAFAPRPCHACRWCWYGQSKKAEGGPGLCRY